MANIGKIEVDADFINKLYMIAELTPPEYSEIDLNSLKELVGVIENEINQLKLSKSESDKVVSELLNAKDKTGNKNVLIIDDLCIITYQLGVLFKSLGYNITVAQDMYDATDKYKKTNFDIVIIDLFLPTEKEGFILLDELVKLRKIKNIDTKIGIMTASAKKEHQELCKEKGAAFYIEKTENWQKNLINVVQGE